MDAPGRHRGSGYSGEHVVVATGTASGKSLGYLLPAFATLSIAQAASPRSRGSPLSCTCRPTKALARRPARARTRRAQCPGCGPRRTTATRRRDERRLGPRPRQRTCSPTPTCCTARCCRGTSAGRGSCAALQYVVVDECHDYRGVFGSHVAGVLRRLRRVARQLRRHPTSCCASATVAEPAGHGDAADRAAGDGGHGGRLAPRRHHLRPVGAAADARRRGRTARPVAARARPRPPTC